MEVVRERSVPPARTVAEVVVRLLSDARLKSEVRLAVLGASEAGKSTLVGVLSAGAADAIKPIYISAPGAKMEARRSSARSVHIHADSLVIGVLE